MVRLARYETTTVPLQLLVDLPGMNLTKGSSTFKDSSSSALLNLGGHLSPGVGHLFKHPGASEKV